MENANAAGWSSDNEQASHKQLILFYYLFEVQMYSTLTISETFWQLDIMVSNPITIYQNVENRLHRNTKPMIYRHNDKL